MPRWRSHSTTVTTDNNIPYEHHMVSNVISDNRNLNYIVIVKYERKLP